ncbi:PREDICTED: M-phase-specific PLK1-interacting protein [Nanorana parkeri]|uniref:M-phase-specific PLK1-interacting protein n=1 Tax=Nanorana parkeri TaxID=125878 RepID=UPI00085413EE|nr:PREDICTED: M-phase-specific PLK1-interacting protein [Nanorana parkeri]
MYRPNFRSPNPCGSGGGEGSPGSFRSPGPLGSGSPMLPPPLPPWGYGSPHTPNYGQRPPRPYGSGGGQSPRSSPSQNPYGGWYGGQSPGNTPPRRASPRYNLSPYSKSPGGGNHYQQHNARGYSPRPAANYQGSPRTSTPYGTAHGREKRVSNDVENYYRPSMLEDPWANLKPLSLSDLDQQNSSEQTTNTGRRGRYFS